MTNMENKSDLTGTYTALRLSNLGLKEVQILPTTDPKNVIELLKKHATSDMTYSIIQTSPPMVVVTNATLDEIENIRQGRNLKTTTGHEADAEGINHPVHYNSHPSGIECIVIVRHMSFNLGNVVKYLWRDGIKDTEVELQDLKKALWYLQDEIERRENG